ncbi:hypothetical protein BJX76DRAFT_361534 [Aspergillus varians]
MDQVTTSTLQNLSTLSSDQRTALIDSIARKMTVTMLTISQEIQRGNLDLDNTAPMHNFIRTIQRHERALLRKLERKAARYQHRARFRRAERRRIRRQFAEIARRMEATETGVGIKTSGALQSAG